MFRMTFNMAKPLIYKKRVLTPLTLAEAESLDKGDTIKYVGPAEVLSPNGLTIQHGAYSAIGRRPIKLQRKPLVTQRPGKARLEIKARDGFVLFNCRIDYLALAERGISYEQDLGLAKRYIPGILVAAEKNLSKLQVYSKERIDHYLDRLPLHIKLDVFKEFTPKQQALYDFLYADPEIVLGLKEDTDAQSS